MKIAQASTMLNSVFATIIGESAVVNEDMSNIVSVGQIITASSEFNDNLNQYTKSMWDKVGQTLYYNGEYKSSAPDIYATNAEYGSVLEKLRIIPGDYENSMAWNTTPNGGSTFDDLFGYHAANVKAKYFNGVATYRTDPVTITHKQLKSAFASREDMLRFIGMLEQVYISKIRMAFDFLVRMTINTYMALKIRKNNNGVVNLLAEYRTATGDTSVTETNWRGKPEFLRFAGEIWKKYSDMIIQPSMLYNTDGYVNYPRKSDIKGLLLTDFVRAMETNVYSDTFNPEYVRMDGYEIVPFWQGIGTDNSYDERSTIDIIPPAETGVEQTPVKQSGIVGLLFDKRGCMINAQETETGVQHNDFDKWDNYIWQASAGYFVDTGENGIIFIIKEPVVEA